MTTIKSNLLRTLANRPARHQEAAKNNAFTLVELLVVVVIVGILSAVALPQFFSQTKKAAATEGTQQASSIAKQASAYYLENGAIANGATHTNCSAYAGTIKTDNTNFTYACSGTKDAFVVTATGKDGNDNTKGVVVKITANLTDGTFSKPQVTGI
jgi:type IV pilus assembly protein PilA